jgi:hypothetical protein
VREDEHKRQALSVRKTIKVITDAKLIAESQVYETAASICLPEGVDHGIEVAGHANMHADQVKHNQQTDDKLVKLGSQLVSADA